MTSSLITYLILYLHVKEVDSICFTLIHETDSFGHHNIITKCGLIIIHAISIMGITKTNHFKSVTTLICEHEIFGTLKMPQNSINHFLVDLTKITQVPIEHVSKKCNISKRLHTWAYIRLPTPEEIRDYFHLISLNIITWTLTFRKTITLHNCYLNRRTWLHIKHFQIEKINFHWNLKEILTKLMTKSVFFEKKIIKNICQYSFSRLAMC